MPDSRCALLRWQFEPTWSLLDFHLEQLAPDDHLWEPAALCWSVRPGEDGRSRRHQARLGGRRRHLVA